MYTNFGVHVWGFCIDPQGEASFAFGATEEFKIVREQEKLSLNSTIKDWETKFRCALFIYSGLFIVLTRRRRYLILNERDPSAAYPAILPSAMAQNESENKRDRFRRSLGTILLGQVCKSYSQAPAYTPNLHLFYSSPVRIEQPAGAY